MEKFDAKKYAEWCKQEKKNPEDASNIEMYLKAERELKEQVEKKKDDAKLQKVLDAMCDYCGCEHTELTTAKDFFEHQVVALTQTVVQGQIILGGIMDIAEKLGE